MQKELDAGKKRCGELSALFKRLYEDNVLGRVTNEQFRMLSADYNAEQKALKEAIPRMEARLEELRASVANVEAFIEKAKRYTAIEELTPDLLRLFIRRIEIGERGKKYSRSSGQSVRIFYRDIGAVDSGMLPGEAKPALSASQLHQAVPNTGQPQRYSRITEKADSHSCPPPSAPGADGSGFVPIDRHPAAGTFYY